MKKIFFFVSAALLLCGPWPNTARATNIELVVRGVECLENAIAVRFSVINTRDFDLPNANLCFSVSKNEKPIAGKELRVVIPRGADGSQIYETIIKTPCAEESYGLRSTLFHNARRYQIEEWFAGCPGPWKSKRNDELVRSAKASGIK